MSNLKHLNKINVDFSKRELVNILREKGGDINEPGSISRIDGCPEGNS